MTVENIPITSTVDWLQRRQHDVTASDTAPVLGVHPNRTPAKVWAEKTGLIAPQPQTEFLEFRLAQEAAVVQMLKFRRPTWDIRRAGVYLRDPDLRYGATPDVVATDPEREGFGVVECKTAIRSVYERDWREIDEGLAEAPLWHQLQVLAGGDLAGASWCGVAALIYDSPGTGTFVYSPVERNAEVETRIRDAVARFWAAIDIGKQPPLNYALDADVIAALHPDAKIKEPLDLSADNRIRDLLIERAGIKTKFKELEPDEQRCDAIEAEIKDKLGAHQLATLPGWRLSWKEQVRKERVTPEWRGRVLRITETTRKG